MHTTKKNMMAVSGSRQCQKVPECIRKLRRASYSRSRNSTYKILTLEAKSVLTFAASISNLDSKSFGLG